MNARRWFEGLTSGLALVLVIALLAGQAAAQERVGVNGAVNPAGTGTPPNGPAKQLVIGQEVVFKERINTEAQGQTQVVFLDESSLSVGPNSNLLIDEFVYDPHANTGKLAMSATRGVFRFVGGKLSKNENAVSMQTPVGTIGIRGGAFLAVLNGNQLEVTLIYGRSLTVTGGGGGGGCRRTLSRPGYKVAIAGAGACPSEPIRVLAEEVAAILAQLDGRIGGTGGARNIPTDQRVAVSGIGTVVSGNTAASVKAALAAAGLPCQAVNTVQAVAGQLVVRCVPPTDPGGIQTALHVNTVRARDGRGTLQQFGQTQPPMGPTPPAPTPTPTPTPPPGPYSGAFNSANANGIANGFPNAATPFAGGNLVNGVFTVTLANGNSITLSPLTPGTQTSVTGQGPFGTVSGTAFLSPDSSFFYATLSSENAPSQVALVEAGIPITANAQTIGSPNQVLAFNIVTDAALASAIPFIRNQTGGLLSNPSVSPLYIFSPTGTLAQDPTGQNTARTLQASLAISGTGSEQQSVLVTHIGLIAPGGGPQILGLLRGSSLLTASGTPTAIGSAVSSIIDGSGASLYGATGISGFALSPGSGLAGEFPVSQVATNYNFNQPALATSLPTGVGGNRTFIPSSGFFGGVMDSTATGAYGVTGQTTFTQTGPGTFSAQFVAGSFVGNTDLSSITMNFGGPASGTPNSTIIDGNIYAATEGSTQQINGNTLVVSGDPSQAGRLYLLSGNTAPLPNSLLPGGSLCSDCAYLQWGYWGGQLLSGNPNDSNINRIEAAHINFWVAGQPTVNLPPFGFGSYSGNVIGAVNNNGNRYIATGTFDAGYDFGNLSGSFNINNFDGISLSGTISHPSGPSAPGGAFTGSLFGGSAVGTVSGKFFGPITPPVGSLPGVPAEIGGNFTIQNPYFAPTYFAAGVFAGRGIPTPPP